MPMKQEIQEPTLNHPFLQHMEGRHSVTAGKPKWWNEPVAAPLKTLHQGGATRHQEGQSSGSKKRCRIMGRNRDSEDKCTKSCHPSSHHHGGTRGLPCLSGLTVQGGLDLALDSETRTLRAPLPASSKLENPFKYLKVPHLERRRQKSKTPKVWSFNKESLGWTLKELFASPDTKI
jgi:hypothetical protein